MTISLSRLFTIKNLFKCAALSTIVLGQHALALNGPTPANCSAKLSLNYSLANISFTCNEDVDLNQATIAFTVPKSAINDISTNMPPWGFQPWPINPHFEVAQQADGDYLVTIPLDYNLPYQVNTTLVANAPYKVDFVVSSQLQASDIQNIQLIPHDKPLPPSQGELDFTVAKGLSLPADTQITVTEESGLFTKTFAYATSAHALTGLPFGHYDISASSAEKPIKILPTSTDIVINKKHPQQSVTLKPINGNAKLDIQLAFTQPADVHAHKVRVHIQDITTNQTALDVNVPWGGDHLIKHLYAEHSYLLSANDIAGRDNTYSFSFSNLGKLKPGTNIVSMQTTQTPISKGELKVNFKGIAHLPKHEKIKLQLTNSEARTKAVWYQNHQRHAFAVGQYSVLAESVDIKDHAGNTEEYTADPVNDVNVNASKETVLNIHYHKVSHTAVLSPYIDISLNDVMDWTNTQPEPAKLPDLIQTVNSSLPEGLQLKHITAAFIVSAGGTCQAAWAGQSQYAVSRGFGAATFKKLHDMGIGTTISFGGQSNTYLAEACSTSDSLVTQYENVISTYHPEGLDFDVEGNAQVNQPMLTRLLTALKVIHAKYPELRLSLTLPVLPTGLVDALPLAQQAVKDIPGIIINLMTMDYGVMQEDMGLASIMAAQAVSQQLNIPLTQIGITPMIGMNDSNGEIFYANQDTQHQSMVDVASFVKENHMPLLAFWDLNRDQECASISTQTDLPWTSPQLECSGIHSGQYGFVSAALSNL